MTEENKRPNENYNLSYPDGKKNENNENVTFYYNRERRLANAPKEVQDMYKENKQSRFGLFSVLVADRPRRFLFLIIVLMCAIIIIVSRIGLLDNNAVLDGNKLEITGTIFEDNTIVLIKKTARNDSAYTGDIDIAVSVPLKLTEDEMAVYSHRIYFSLEKNEAYRFAAPFNAPELLIVLQNDKSEVRHKFKPE